MRYRINSCKEGIGPRATEVLKSLTGVPLFHSSYGLRHPSELYVHTFGEAVSHLSQLTDEVVSVDARGSYLPRSGDPWEVVEDGMVGPDPDIHEGSNVAISFYRDIPFRVVNLYHVSCAVAQAAYEIIKARPTSSQEHMDLVGWSELLRKDGAASAALFSG